MPYDETDLSRWLHNYGHEQERMTIAEPRETVTPKHVALALEECSNINGGYKYWAELDITSTPVEVIVRMRVGNIRQNDGVREKANEIVRYSLEHGVVRVTSQCIP